MRCCQMIFDTRPRTVIVAPGFHVLIGGFSNAAGGDGGGVSAVAMDPPALVDADAGGGVLATLATPAVGFGVVSGDDLLVDPHAARARCAKYTKSRVVDPTRPLYCESEPGDYLQ